METRKVGLAAASGMIGLGLLAASVTAQAGVVVPVGPVKVVVVTQQYNGDRLVAVGVTNPKQTAGYLGVAVATVNRGSGAAFFAGTGGPLPGLEAYGEQIGQQFSYIYAGEDVTAGRYHVEAYKDTRPIKWDRDHVYVENRQRTTGAEVIADRKSATYAVGAGTLPTAAVDAYTYRNPDGSTHEAAFVVLLGKKHTVNH